MISGDSTILRMLLAAGWVMSSLGQTPAQESPNQNLSESLQFARDRAAEALVESGDNHWQQGDIVAAIQDWQFLLDSQQDPWVLVDGVHRSGWEVANERLARLTADARELLDRTLEAHAAQAIEDARRSQTPDLLLQLALRYRHTRAGDEAWQDLVSLADDRGEQILAQRLTQAWLEGRSPSQMLATTIEPRSRHVRSAPREDNDPSLSGRSTSSILAAPWTYSEPLLPGIRQLAQESLEELDAQGMVPLLAARPVLWERHLVARTLSGVVALDAETGASLWTMELPSAIDQLRDASASLTDPLRRISAEKVLTHRLVSDVVTESLVVNDDRVYVLVPEPDRPPRRATPAEGSSGGASPLRIRLLALSLHDGHVLWQAGGRARSTEQDEADTNEADTNPSERPDITFLGPPTFDGDLLLILGESESAIRLWAIRAADGVEQWSVPIGRLVRGISQDVARQGRACPVIVERGRAYCASGAGALVCIDLLSRRRLWGVRLGRDDVATEQGALTEQPEVVSGPTRARWHRVQVQVDGEVVILATPETDHLIAVDARTGRLRWTRSRGSGLFVLTSQAGQVVVIGSTAAHGLRTQTGEVTWTSPIPRPCGEGWTANGNYMFPAQSGLRVSLRLRDGDVRPGNSSSSWSLWAPRLQPAAGGSFRAVAPRNLVRSGANEYEQRFDRVSRLNGKKETMPVAEDAPQSNDDGVAASADSFAGMAFGFLQLISSGIPDTGNRDVLEWSGTVLRSYSVALSQPRLQIRLDRWLHGFADDLTSPLWSVGSTQKGQVEVPSSQPGIESAEAPSDQSLPSELQIDVAGIDTWPARRPLVTESTSVFDYTQLVPVPVSAPRGSVWDGMTVSVDRQGRGIWFDDAGAGRPWRVNLPPDRSGTRIERRMDRAWGLESLLVVRVGLELFGVRPFGPNGERVASVAWPAKGRTLDLRGERPPLLVSLTESEDAAILDSISYEDRFSRPVGVVGPVTQNCICYRERGHLVALDPADGSEIWRRSDLPVDYEVCGTDEAIVVLPSGDHSREVLRPVDGRTMRRLAHPADDLRVLLRRGTSWLCEHEGDVPGDDPGTDPSAIRSDLRAPHQIQRIDIAEERLDWESVIPADSVLFEVDDAWFGLLAPDGVVSFVDWESGLSVARTSVDVPPGKLQIHVITDAERIVMLMSSQVSDPRVVKTSQILSGYRRCLVNGSVCVFQRDTGALLWRREFENVGVPLDQPRHVPLLVTNFTRQDSPQGTSTGLLQCFDLRTGDLLFEREDDSHIYFSVLASRPEEWLKLQLRQHTVFMDYSTGD